MASNPAEAEREPGLLSKAITVLAVIVVVVPLLLALQGLVDWVTDSCRYDGGSTCVVREDVAPVPLTDGRSLDVRVELRTSADHRAWVQDLHDYGSRASTDLRDAVAAAVNARDAAAVWRDPAGVERDVAKAVESRFPWVNVTFVRIDPAGS